MRQALEKIVSRLEKKHNVTVEQYAPYRDGALFLAYPKGLSNADKKMFISPYFLYDPATDEIGPFSPAFDFDGFFSSIEKMKPI